MASGSATLVLIFVTLFALCLAEECPELRMRREWRTLSHEEHIMYYDALHQLKKNGFYNMMIGKHNQYQRYSHVSSGLLPWHRMFILEMENGIRALGGNFSCYALPYWDWSADTYDAFNTPLWTDDEGVGIIREGCISTGPFGGIMRAAEDTCVGRQSPVYNPAFTSFAALQDLIQSRPFYVQFENNFEGVPHGMVHSGVSGDMGATHYSPGDPIFWLHHNFVDKVWAMWQDCWDYDTIPEESLGEKQYWESDSRLWPDNAPIDMVIPGYDLTPRQVYNWTKFHFMWETWEWEVEQMETFVRPSVCRYDLFNFYATSSTPSTPDNTSATNVPSNITVGDEGYSRKFSNLRKQIKLSPSTESAPERVSLLSYGQKLMISAAKKAFEEEYRTSGDNARALKAAVAAECAIKPMPDLPEWYIKANGLEQLCHNTTHCTSPCKLLSV